MRTVSYVSARAAGAALIALGLVTDLGAGLMILSGDVATGLATHIPAVMVWALGARLAGRDPIVAGTIALVTFPGVGSAGLTLAGVIWPFLTLHNRRSKEGQLVPRMEVAMTVPEVPPIDQLRELEVEPLVDALRHGDPVLKRGAIDFLGRQPRPDAVRLVRRLLTDPDVDVRNEAAVTLSRLENDMTRAIFAAADAVDKAPRDPQKRAALGRLYREYAESGLAEPVLRRHHLLQARKELLRALEIDGRSQAAKDRWLELAAVHHALGNHREARVALDHAGENDPTWTDGERVSVTAAAGGKAPVTDKAIEIALKVALAERNWTRMRELGWPGVAEAEGEYEPGVPRQVAPHLAGATGHVR